MRSRVAAGAGKQWGRGLSTSYVLLVFSAVLTLSLSGLLPARAQSSAPPPIEPLYQPHSRHPLTLLEVYAESLQVLNPHLSYAQAATLAQAVIDEGKRAEVDARLVVAILQTEGQLSKVRSRGKTVLFGTVDARKTIAATAKELGDGIHDAVAQGAKGEAAVRQALASRAVAQHQTDAAAKKYPSKVLRLYRQLCGS